MVEARVPLCLFAVALHRSFGGFCAASHLSLVDQLVVASNHRSCAEWGKRGDGAWAAISSRFCVFFCVTTRIFLPLFPPASVLW